MPISRRDKEVSLTKTKKVTKERKLGLIEEIRKCVESYDNLFVFTTSNLRGTFLGQIRQKFKKTSRIFYGKNNLMSVALGKSAEDEVFKDLHKVSRVVKGECGIMFTSEAIKDIKRFFAEFAEDDFARAGATIDQEIELPQGTVTEFAGSLEPQLRKLGLPTRLADGKIELLSNHVVCRAGDALTPEQSRILKLYGIKTTTFKVDLKAHWSKKNGFKELN